MANTHNSKAIVGQKSKKMEEKKVLPLGLAGIGTRDLQVIRPPLYQLSYRRREEFWAEILAIYRKAFSKINLNSKLLLNKKFSDQIGENFSFTIINFCHIFSLVNYFLYALLHGLYLVTKKFFFKNVTALPP